MLNKKFKLFIIIQLLFFIPAFFTLKDYGISWDEPTHFKRGQGYLWFLLTGDNHYYKLPKYDLTRAQNDPTYHERSFYQDDKQNSAFYRSIDGSHPPLADILASTTNMIFYQKLGWVGDVESYHLFEIFVASIGVATLFIFVYESFGIKTAFFSTVFFATFPLFWSESHFNIKDPIETSWIILLIYFFWKGIKEKRGYFLIISSIFCGFALGTKLNVIFAPLIIGPWLIFLLRKYDFKKFLTSKQFVLPVLIYPIITFAIFYFSYPFLWNDPIQNIGKVLLYYERNALDPSYANALLPNWSFYAIRWVLFTTPPLVLLGLFFSGLFIRKLLFKHHGVCLLALIWFLVTLIRVSIPGVNIYGGVRQIMEYIPAISILAGIGFGQILEKKSKLLSTFIFLLVFIVSILPLFKLHPNENVYFNFLAGDLKGAVESGFPAAGNSFGNAYYQGVKWINANATPNTRLTVIQGSSVNIPKYKLRSNIDLSDNYFSGINREGEYLIALTYNFEHQENFYSWEYLDKFLKPVFEIKADNVPILKIWKNDLENTKPEYRLKEVRVDDNEIKISGNKIEIDIKKESLLSSLSVDYESENDCLLSSNSSVETSRNGNDWLREKDSFSFSQIGKRVDTFSPAWKNSSSKKSIPNKRFNFYFAGRSANFIRINLNEQSCFINYPKIEVSELISF